MPLDKCIMCGTLAHMKKQLSVLSIIGAALVTIAVLSSSTPNSIAQHRSNPGAVVFGAQQEYQNGYPVGYRVYVVSKGQHAPQVLPGSDLATTLETLLENGFEIKDLVGFQFMAIRK